MLNAYLQLQDVAFVYNEETIPVWQGLSCSFCANTINLLLGPSGCGKSSLLYLIDGLIPHSLEGKLSGEMTLAGESILGVEPRALTRRVGLVFQDPDTQFCTFLVEDELAFGLENLCVPPEEMDARIDRALALVGLEGMRRRMVTSLSGGEKQKLAIACALIMDVELLLLDEPTAMLDASSRREIVDLLQRLVAEHGKTVILVEHNLDELMPHIGHIVAMDRGGRVVLEGSAHDVFTRLTFDTAFADLPVYLPQPLLILRQWLHARPDPRLAAFCAAQLNKPGNGAYEFPYEELAALIQSLLPAPEALEAARQGDKSRPPAAAAAPFLNARGLTFGYNGAPVLEEVGFAINEGEFIAIAGPNGAGKSTLLNLLFQTLKGYAGEISIFGQSLANIKPQALYRKMGLLFQNPEWQFVTNGVEDELLFSLKKSPLSPGKKKAAVDRLLRQFHLEHQRDKSPFLLSQGEKRRLSVACMLLTGQRILFFDEPTYGQDRETTAELMALLQTLHAQGVTVVIVTHDMGLVAEYAERLLLLCDGRIAFDGVPAELFKKELLPCWRTERPPVWSFSQRLGELVPAFPVFLQMNACIAYLNSLTREGSADA